MVFSRFIWSIAGGVSAITATSVVLGIYLQKPGYPYTRSLLVVLLILETVFLVYYLFRIRRDLLRLIVALRNEDPTLQFSRVGRDPFFGAIHHGFNQIIRDFRLVRLDREAEHQFFEATVNHIRFGILAFDSEGMVEIANDAFLELFGLDRVDRIDSLGMVSPELPGWLRELAQQRESLKKLTIGGRPTHLIFLASRFKIKGREITLVSVRDISREIDRNELEAWQKLLRVLRHEILNSITPIKLISSNLSGMLRRDGKVVPVSALSNRQVRDIRTGLDTIHRRASSLSGFLDAYSNLYRVPELKLIRTSARDLMQRISKLFSGQFESEGIRCHLRCGEPDPWIEMDERMIEQVLINLVKNAVEAVRGQSDPAVTLSAWESPGEACMAVGDNGKGIPEDQLDQIFIPFYSTREEGSGVGLSFSQHIMRLHQGRIHVRSIPGKGSEFQLVFRKE
jgi:two-component system nitrogen regulation sensor histidine kinase NtrY